jgi:hypothetical protein
MGPDESLCCANGLAYKSEGGRGSSDLQSAAARAVCGEGVRAPLQQRPHLQTEPSLSRDEGVVQGFLKGDL